MSIFHVSPVTWISTARFCLRVFAFTFPSDQKALPPASHLAHFLSSVVCSKVTLPKKLYLTTLYKKSSYIVTFSYLALFFFIKFLHYHHLAYFWSLLFLYVSPRPLPQNVRSMRTGMLSEYFVAILLYLQFSKYCPLMMDTQ